MANKNRLRKLRKGTVINETSEKREGKAASALNRVISYLSREYGVKINYDTRWYLKDIISKLKIYYPEVVFFYNFKTSHMRPDGGIL
jgi:hypothetical protein